MVEWLRLFAPIVGGLGSIPGQGTKSHMLQLRIPTTKTWHSQINKNKKNLREGKCSCLATCIREALVSSETTHCETEIFHRLHPLNKLENKN